MEGELKYVDTVPSNDNGGGVWIKTQGDTGNPSIKFWGHLFGFGYVQYGTVQWRLRNPYKT
jgi:hypothetical protein